MEAATPQSSVAQRRRQGALAGHVGDQDAAREAFGDPHPAVRAAGLGALVRLRALTQVDLDSAAKDESILVRRRVGELARSIADLGRSPGEHNSRLAGRAEVIAALAGMLSDSDPSLVEAASFGIGEACLGEASTDTKSTETKSTDAKTLAKLCEIARAHPDTLCRESAVAALGCLESPEGLGALLDAMGDKPSVRRRAVIALASFESALAHDAIESALSDRDWQVRQAAEDLSGTLGSGPVAS